VKKTTKNETKTVKKREKSLNKTTICLFIFSTQLKFAVKLTSSSKIPKRNFIVAKTLVFTQS
jgi:hypothetical protein